MSSLTTKYRHNRTSKNLGILRKKALYRFGQLPKNPIFLRIFTLIFVLSIVGGIFSILPSIADASSVSPIITQEGYVFENDDNSSVDGLSQLAGSEFSSGKTLDSIRKGELINLRMQLTNHGTAISPSDELGLFYDRNSDGIWTKVQNSVPALTSTGNCSNTDFTCDTIDSTNYVGGYDSIAFDSEGRAWISYKDDTADNLKVAVYVGSGGSCASTQWNCIVLDSTGNVGEYSAIAIDNNGNPWIAYRDVTNGYLKVANYVGSGGSCDASAWDCNSVDTSFSSGWYPDIATDQSGTPWISYVDDNVLGVAKYVGSGGSCDNAAWDCTTVDSGSSVLQYSTSIAIDSSGNPWISYAYNVSAVSTLKVAEYVGSGGSCSDSAWDCAGVNGSNNDGRKSSIAFDSSGNAWVAFWNSSSNILRVAQYVGSGGSCGNAAWDCTTIDSSGTVATYLDLAFDPSGAAWISYKYGTSPTSLKVANYVGSGGNCTSAAWDCVVAQSNSNFLAYDVSMAFSPNGSLWLSHLDASGGDLLVARIIRAGEISSSPSLYTSAGDTLGESHADMTSSTDTTGRDDSDCLDGSASWNNGVSFSSMENAVGLSLPAGNSTPQCSEVTWTLDTSQAVPGATYRFVVATKDGFRVDHGLWRGPAFVASNGYPTLTMRTDEQSVYRYSKGALGSFDSDCTNTAWGCTVIDGVQGRYGEMKVSPSGQPWVISYDQTNFNAFVAKYVGSGGNCDAIEGTDSGGSDAWECTDIHSTQVGIADASIAFDKTGKPFISFQQSWNLVVGEYVGSGGSGNLNCAAEWECTTVNGGGSPSDSSGNYTAITVDSHGDPWVVYSRFGPSTQYHIRAAHYVGSGGNCDSLYSGSDAWDCFTVQGSSGQRYAGDIAISPSGTVWVSYRYGSDLMVARSVYIPSGQFFFTYETVDNRASNLGYDSSIAFDASGNPIVSYGNDQDDGISLAEYVGSGGDCDSIGSGSDGWNCTLISSVGSTYATSTSIANDSQGNLWIAAIQYSNPNYIIKVAHYVGSGGNCDNEGGPDAWQCDVVSTGALFLRQTSLAFDSNNTPVIYYEDANNNLTNIARLKLPDNQLSYSTLRRYDGRSAGSGDLSYILSDGTSPGSDAYGLCGGNSGSTGYCGLYHPEGHLDSITALTGEKPIYGFSTRYGTNSYLPTANLYFQTDVSPASKNVVLQVYRFGTTNAWETVSTYSSAGCSTANCLIRGMPSGTASEYFEADNGNYWVHFRVYQVETTSSITFSVDSFKAEVTPATLRGGRVFREQISDPFGW